MKSILQKKNGTCYLCMMLHGDYSRKEVQEHHVIFGTANRRLSEKYGLKVYLCLSHHEEGQEAVHRNAEIARMLKAQAQRAFGIRFPGLDWMKIFGKNYDTDPKKKEPAGQQELKKNGGKEPGFRLLDIDLGEIDW